jgi:integrase
MARDTDSIDDLFGRFVGWYRQMGWRYVMAPTHLSALSHFLEERGVTRIERVDTALLLDYRRDLLSTRSATTVNGYLSTLRALWRFLLRQGLVDTDVTAGLPRPPQDHFVPHLYTQSELSQIEKELKRRVGQAHGFFRRLSCMVRLTAFRLMSDCGLRVSEACRLDLPHYDARRRLLRIERTKFFKTRVIRRLLDAYLQRIDSRLLDRCQGSAPLLLSVNGRRLARQHLEHSFKQLLVEIGLYHPRRRRGRTVFGSTNLHALRHDFAVRCLERWQGQGLDVDRLMPLLSGYMGHCHVSYTHTYLHLTPQLHKTASKRFEDKVLPLLDGPHEGPPLGPGVGRGQDNRTG